MIRPTALAQLNKSRIVSTVLALGHHQETAKVFVASALLPKALVATIVGMLNALSFQITIDYALEVPSIPATLMSVPEVRTAPTALAHIKRFQAPIFIDINLLVIDVLLVIGTLQVALITGHRIQYGIGAYRLSPKANLFLLCRRTTWGSLQITRRYFLTHPII
ncbi:hypothetical protein sscle_16g109030 [Sclerotinia sclerotiorum 1980 UF-70]|uniref:Uncharacterized protein n=1 Tax=Sclerotinia sclerotiorum (strain ATCC 18683 / 1980 / Ss-1) TaxID=665079 RepID=A0A1D9QNE0_SCLS1|nr:hypothetical protein sscle_16g109030 [Sclerotinia sclerotiorum 1980 UF-70]